jgi:hypothetical protein
VTVLPPDAVLADGCDVIVSKLQAIADELGRMADDYRAASVGGPTDDPGGG